jgi:hypothetical protein
MMRGGKEGISRPSRGSAQPCRSSFCSGECLAEECTYPVPTEPKIEFCWRGIFDDTFAQRLDRAIARSERAKLIEGRVVSED